MGAGFRKIVVQGRVFRWRFEDRLVIIPDGESGPPLYVRWGWRDWVESVGPGNEPLIVTPRFVAAAIRFGLEHGWGPDRDKSPVELGFSGDTFQQLRPKGVASLDGASSRCSSRE